MGNGTLAGAGAETVGMESADEPATFAEGENRSISVSSGVFSDTFASGLTVHIYQVNG